jgi:hypothetical protein
MDAAGTVIGASAIGSPLTAPGATPSPTTAPAWHDTTGCPATVENGFRAGIKRTGMTVTVTKLDASTVSGPTVLPNLNQGMPASCAFRLTTGAVAKTDEVFIGMPQSGMSDFQAKLVAAGFASVPGVAGSLAYVKDGGDVILAYASNAGVSAVTVVG